MFIKINFKQSEVKSYLSKEDATQYVLDKNIPIDKRVNIFTKDEVEKLNSILDSNLITEEIKTFSLLEKQNLFKETWFYGEDSKTKEEAYLEKYNASDGLDLYVVKSDMTYIVDTDLLLLTIDRFNTKVIYTVVGQLKDMPSAFQSSENKVLEKLLSLEEKLSLFDKTQQFNTKVGVHISDLGLLNIKEVDVLEDICTDTLQKWLDEGWRIITVCPQPDKRRPDYILGRNERMVTRKRRECTCK